MEEQEVLSTNKQEAEILFAAHALQGLLAGNSLLGRMPEDLAKTSVNIGKAVAQVMFPAKQLSEDTV